MYYLIDVMADVGEKILSVLLFFSQYYGRYRTDTNIMRDTGGRILFVLLFVFVRFHQYHERHRGEKIVSTIVCLFTVQLERENTCLYQCCVIYFHWYCYFSTVFDVFEYYL